MRVVGRHGGTAIGTVSPVPPVVPVSELIPGRLPAILFDCTHDNVTPAQRRHPGDALSSAALVAAAVCAVGSVRGYDLLVPENPSVVSEKRLYALAEPSRGPASEYSSGILPARKVLNALHASLAVNGYNQVRPSLTTFRVLPLLFLVTRLS